MGAKGVILMSGLLIIGGVLCKAFAPENVRAEMDKITEKYKDEGLYGLWDDSTKEYTFGAVPKGWCPRLEHEIGGRVKNVDWFGHCVPASNTMTVKFRTGEKWL